MESEPAAPPAEPAPPRRPGPLVVSAVFLVLAAGAWLAGRQALVPGPEEPAAPGTHGEPEGELPPPVYAVVPDFSLTERSGRTVTLADLKGKFWVVDFIFTNCAGICPQMSSRMERVHEAFLKDPDAVCVSITVDPERDTPEVLAAYAGHHGASADRWLFLRGDVRDVLALSYDGLHIGDEKDPFVHSQRFVLVDPEGRIRGYYRGTEDPEVDRLLEDYRRIRAEGP